MDVELPAPAIRAGQVPEVCARHGKPATHRRRVRFVSRTPRWIYLLLLLTPIMPLALVAVVVVAAVLRKSVRAEAWPFCDECRGLRKRRVLLGIGLLVLGFVAVAIGASLGPVEGRFAALFTAGFVALLIGGLLMLWLASPSDIVGAHVSDDGEWVRFHKAHPAFAPQVPRPAPTPVGPGA